MWIPVQNGCHFYQFGQTVGQTEKRQKADRGAYKPSDIAAEASYYLLDSDGNPHHEECHAVHEINNRHVNKKGNVVLHAGL